MKKLQIPLLTTSLYFLSTTAVFAQIQDTARNLTSNTETKVDIGAQVQGFFGFTCILDFVFNIVSIALLLAGLILFVYLVWGGIEWLTSGGDKGKVEAARNRIVSALVGLAIIAASWALVRIIGYFFGIEAGLSTFTIPKPY